MASESLGVEELMAMVHEAFPGEPRGDHMGLEQAFAADDCAPDEERATAIERDRQTADQPWWEVKDESIRWASAAIGFLDNDGFRYYMPALLSWSLRNQEGADRANMLHESIIYQLRWRHPALFTPDQRRVIAAFLDRAAREEEIHEPHMVGEYSSRDIMQNWLSRCSAIDEG